MTEGTKEYNHSRIVEWIEDRFKKKEIYRDLDECREFQAEVKVRKKEKFFIYPRLSIDLIRVNKVPKKAEEEMEKGKKTKELNHYTLFFAISSKTIFEKEEMDALERRLLFYQFYLSYISEPRRIKIIVVVPHNVEVPEQSLKFLKESGFGLWKVNIEEKEGKEEEEVYSPKSLRDRMAEEFKESIDDPKKLGETIKRIFKKKAKDFPAFKEAIKDTKMAEKFALFFERDIRKSVAAIAGVKQDKFGMRYIDRRLLNLILELDKVSYVEKLKDLVNQHLDEDEDDYAFVSEVFSALWEEEIGIPYSKFLKTFEPALLHVFPEGEGEETKVHRDHYIHQFQVFLLGLYIIDKFHEYFTDKCKWEKPELKWLIMSSFHDMAYPIQLYDEWSKKFFKQVFNVPLPLARMELKSSFVEESFLSCMGYLICSLYGLHTKEKKLEGNWLADKKELVQFFYREITEGKNHCVLSSMSLLKMVKDPNFDEENIMRKNISGDGPMQTFATILKDVFAPSALAIALHDKGVWEQLRKESGKDHPLRILNGIQFESDPLSFLLIFCDNIQEWGRPLKSPAEEKGRKERAMTFHLEDIKVDPKKTRLDVTIWTPQHKRTEQFFIDKLDELRAMQFLLKQPSDIRFTVHLEDEKKDEEVEKFEMVGPISEESIARSE